MLLAAFLSVAAAYAKDGGPQLQNPGPQYSFDGHMFELAIPMEAPKTTLVSFRATGLPDGLSIDPVTGIIAGTVDASGSVCTQVTVYAEAGKDTAETQFDWVVESKGVLSCGGAHDRVAHGGADGLLVGLLSLLVAWRVSAGQRASREAIASHRRN